MNTVLDAALGVSTLSLSAAPSTLPSALATPARSGSDLAEHSKALASDSGFEGSPEMAPFACPVENSPSFGASLPPTGPGSGNGALNGLGSPSLSPSLGALPVPLANGSMAVAEGGEADAEPKKKKKPLTGYSAKAVLSGTYEPERHWYPRVLNAQLHPLVGSFLTLGNERMIARFSHMNPQVRPEALASILSYKPKYFQWAGSDLFNAVNYNGRRQMSMSLIETSALLFPF